MSLESSLFLYSLMFRVLLCCCYWFLLLGSTLLSAVAGVLAVTGIPVVVGSLLLLTYLIFLASYILNSSEYRITIQKLSNYFPFKYVCSCTVFSMNRRMGYDHLFSYCSLSLCHILSQKSSRCCRMMERAFSSIFIFMIGSLGMMSGNAPIITLQGK